MANQNELLPDVPANIHSRGHIHSSSTSTSLATNALSSNNNNNNSNNDELSKVQIYNYLTQYEDKLAELVESVDNFKPDVKIVHELIDVDRKLYKSVDSFSEYDRIDCELKRLDKELHELDRNSKHVLETLSECYEMLNALPMLEEVEFEKQSILKQRSKVNSNVLLNYAIKLSKFTKIPPTFDKGSIGPNNFVWPAEDALRRGMLAMASLHSKELTRIPGESEDKEVQEVDDTEGKDLLKQRPDSSHGPENERRSSFVFTGNPTETINADTSSNGADDEALDLNLDIFNPDEF